MRAATILRRAYSVSGGRLNASKPSHLIWRPVLQRALTTTVPITYIEADGTEKEVQAEIGQNLMEVAHKNNVELEGTVCCLPER
jgi:hypothetical protein